MKKLFFILGAVILVLIILLAGLSLYLSDERLRALVLPQLQEATGRDVRIEHISYSLFRTFPRFGLLIEGLQIPDPVEERLLHTDRLLVTLNLVPLIRREISVDRLLIERPSFMYIVYEDGSTNLDDFFDDSTPGAEPQPLELPRLDLSQIVVTGAKLGMKDHQSQTSIQLSNLDIRSSLRFSEVLESTLDVFLGGLDLTFQGQRMISGLSLTLRQSSILDMAAETLQLETGELNVLGLALSIQGSVSDWSKGEPLLNLEIYSDSDDFGTLLDLVPPDFEEFTRELETGGQFELALNIQGRLAEDKTPGFDARLRVVDGFIQHGAVPDEISNIQIFAHADNNLLVIETFQAQAGETRITASGELLEPLDPSAIFSINGTLFADLSTLDRYLPLYEWDISSLAGLLRGEANARGKLWQPHESEFDAALSLTGGQISHKEIAHPVEDIGIELQATHQRITLTSASLQSAGNRIQTSGWLEEPFLPEQSRFNASAEMQFDLESVGDFYPMDADTLSLRGRLTLTGTAQGLLQDPAASTFNADVNLSGGYLYYHLAGPPLEDLELSVRASRDLLNLTRLSVRSASNQLLVSGTLRNYLEENAQFDLRLGGQISLDEINSYYPVEEEWEMVMSGIIESDIGLNGRIDQPEGVLLDGTLLARNVSIDAPMLLLPLRELNGSLTLQGEHLKLDQAAFYFGSSDYQITGMLRNFKSLMYDPEESVPALFTGNFSSEFFDADEFMNFEDVPEEPEPFEAWLPNLSGSFSGNISRLLFFGMEATEITGTIHLSPRYVRSENARLSLYGGTMEGDFRWDIFAADHTGFTFTGQLDQMRIEELFSHFNLGGQARLAEHVRADFSATTDFYAEFDEYLEMDLMVIRTSGNFGMQEARITGHPIQNSLAQLLGSAELRDLSLDSWTARYNIAEGIMNLEDFHLTSRDLGLRLSGSQHLVEDRLDYRAEVVLPGQWTDRMGNILPAEGAQALRDDDGKLVLPLIIRGTSQNPRPGLDDQAVRRQVEEHLRNRAIEEGREVLDGVLDRLRRN